MKKEEKKKKELHHKRGQTNDYIFVGEKVINRGSRDTIEIHNVQNILFYPNDFYVCMLFFISGRFRSNVDITFLSQPHKYD